MEMVPLVRARRRYHGHDAFYSHQPCSDRLQLQVRSRHLQLSLVAFNSL